MTNLSDKWLLERDLNNLDLFSQNEQVWEILNKS